MKDCPKFIYFFIMLSITCLLTAIFWSCKQESKSDKKVWMATAPAGDRYTQIAGRLHAQTLSGE